MSTPTPLTPTPTHNQPEYSVSEISGALKRVVESQFGYVRVRGELSGFKRAASGHCYMDLKDDKAVLNGIIWRGNAAKLSFKPEDGLEVICSGKLSTYPGRSNYQLLIDTMEPAGLGALMALLEKRKQALAAEGLFAPERKRRLPFMPQTIGVVTSPTGAVIRDILHRLADRFPVHVLLWPVRVQGDGAAEEIAAAIAGFNAMTARPDLLIVARGGGSLEDLWAFNEECVVRAVADCTVPVISAVGHETDTTLIDFVSDQRAPTPTAAAEMAVPVRREWLLTLEDWQSRLHHAMHRRLQTGRERVEGLARGIPSPAQLLHYASQRLDDRAERLHRALPQQVTQARQQLAQLAARLSAGPLLRRIAQQEDMLRRSISQMQHAMRQRLEGEEKRLALPASLLESLNYTQVLKRGFTLVTTPGGALVTSAAEAAKEKQLRVVFHDQALAVRPDEKKPGRNKSQTGQQASLF